MPNTLHKLKRTQLSSECAERGAGRRDKYAVSSIQAARKAERCLQRPHRLRLPRAEHEGRRVLHGASRRVSCR